MGFHVALYSGLQARLLLLLMDEGPGLSLSGAAKILRIELGPVRLEGRKSPSYQAFVYQWRIARKRAKRLGLKVQNDGSWRRRWKILKEPPTPAP